MKFQGLKLGKWFDIPKWCLECHNHIAPDLQSSSSFLCTSCYDSLPFTKDLLCEKCGLAHETICCNTNWSNQINHFHTIFTYDEPVSNWIGKFKYSQSIMEGRLLRSFVTQWFQKNQELIHQFDLLLPVPMHSWNLFRRGFNQTDYLISSVQNMKINNRILKKKHHTKHQAGLTRKKREKNLKGAFEINQNIEGKRILLFDDICTTGGTLRELCKLLHKNKVQNIDILVLCRTI